MQDIQKSLTKARLLFNEKEFDKASAELNQLSGLAGDELYQKLVLESAILVRCNQVEAALEKVSKAEHIAGSETEATVNIKGIAYRARNELLKAKEALERGLEKYPKSVDLAHNLSVTLADIGNFRLAEKAGLKALEINSKYIETYKNLGRIYVTERDTSKARKIFQKLDKLQPNSVDVLVGLGAIELILSRASTAKGYFERALAKDDSLSAAWANLGLCHKFLGDLQSAKKCLITASHKDPNQIEHIWNLALINLTLGEFREGWAQYEARYNPKRIAPDAVKLPNTGIPMLTKRDSVKEKHIILVQEQGYGDTFQFFRFAKNLKDEGAKKLTAIVSKEMSEIVRTLPWIDEIRTEMKDSKEVPDYWVFSMSLPARYAINSVDQIPSYEHYLAVDCEKRQKWQSVLQAREPKKLRVGLVWAGRETHSNDANRSLSISHLEPLLKMHEDIEFVSLQKGPRESDLANDTRVFACGSQLADFADTAALLSNLDLLISVDSSPVHLAGALGMPVWTFIPKIYDFRWLVDRENSPWYPSMKLLRQKQGESWQEVIIRAKEGLEKLVKNPVKRWHADQFSLFPSLEFGASNLAGVPLYLNCAFQYQLKGELDAAENMYQKCLLYEPNSLDSIRNLAALYRAKGSLNRSEEIYQYGEKIGLQDPIFYTNYANLLVHLGRLKDALAKAELALLISPNHEPAAAVKIQCHQKLIDSSKS